MRDEPDRVSEFFTVLILWLAVALLVWGAA